MDMMHDKHKYFKRRYLKNALDINFLIIFIYLSFRMFPERFLSVLKRKIDVKFDAVIGYKSKGE